MGTEPKYKRILLKISGEALAGEQKTGLDFGVIGQVCDVIKTCTELGVQVGVVIGGGNFWRGVKNGEGKMARSRADHMGMLATVMNCLAVSDVMEQKGIPVRVQTAVEMSTFAEHYTWERAVAHLEEGKVVLFGAGSGCPYFRPTRPPCCAPPRSARTRSCSPRTSTASTAPTRMSTPAP